jgi:hypothetical protein
VHSGKTHESQPASKTGAEAARGRRIGGTLACTGTTTAERAQRVLIELATEYEAIAEAAPHRRVKHFSPPRLSGCDYLKHGAPSARGHVVKGHVARPAKNPAVDRTTASDAAPACPMLVRWREAARRSRSGLAR